MSHWLVDGAELSINKNDNIVHFNRTSSVQQNEMNVQAKMLIFFSFVLWELSMINNSNKSYDLL